jgi:LysM repeat protein
MLLLIAVTSWLIEAQFSGDGREPSSGPSDELLELRTQIATLKEDLADTKANQRALLEAMTALRLQNRELRGRIGHSSAKRASHSEWQAPVIEDFAALETTLATGRDAGAVEYRVRHGDTLLGVAHRHQLSLSQIARWNGLATSALLRAGERLVLTPREELNYTVRWGDTLVALRRQFNVTFNELRRWNALPRDGRLYAGQRLRVYVSLPADS